MDESTTTFHHEALELNRIQGEALWSVEAGRLHSLELVIEVSSTGVSKSSFVFNGQEIENEFDHERAGTSTLSIAFEEAEK